MDSTVGATVETINTGGSAPIVLVCEHASKTIPASLDGLGLSRKAAESHAAWDPGALAVALLLSKQLDAPLVAQRISRLVYDCNRPPEAPSAMPEKSEIYDVPGNVCLSDEQRLTRTEQYYRPFQRAVRKALDGKLAASQSPIMVTVHSFTPVYNGKQRDVELGILHDDDTRFADALLAVLEGNTDFNVQRNEPYGPEDGVTHTLVCQAQSRGILNVMIELRNDLIAKVEGQEKLAKLLGDAILHGLSGFKESSDRRDEGSDSTTRAAR
ncbi:N-formylglutamate amidohydrolase [Pseudovibrio sp. Tun.PSC04-5.I4]|uniref:N-formylglutamate amidohydrolase n=1 Tax=Pseudovibrio sp. Tun.PSC04-5.I4 TaxID=1798213 RepID=UPI001AD8ACC9